MLVQVRGLQFCGCNLEILLLLVLKLQQDSISVCHWHGLLSPVQNSCAYSGHSLSSWDYIYIKKKHFELFPILESRGSIGEKNHFLIWRLALRHFTSQGLSLREYWIKRHIPRRSRGLTTINYHLCTCQFKVLNEDSFLNSYSFIFGTFS